MPKLWAVAYVIVVLICGGFAVSVFLRMSPANANPPGQVSPPVQCSPATSPPAVAPTPSSVALSSGSYNLPVPVADIAQMYNAISEDEIELRNVIVAIPVLLTILLAFVPFALGNFVTVRVSEAVKDRVGEAEAALKEARATEKRIDAKLRIAEARISTSIAYIYWTLGDSDEAASRAQLAIEKSNEGLELLRKDEQQTSEKDKDPKEIGKIERFIADAQDSWAYYVAELFVKRGESKLDKDDYVKAKDRGLEILNKLASSTECPIETVDNCLFLVWAFRDRIDSQNLSRALQLFRSQRIPLLNHTWYKLPGENYRKYVNYYNQEWGTLLTAT